MKYERSIEINQNIIPGYYFPENMFLMILAMKYIISTALMREKPVRSPMVPPIADSWSTNLAARSCRVRRLRRS